MSGLKNRGRKTAYGIKEMFFPAENKKGPAVRDWCLLGLVLLPVFLFFCFYHDFSLTMRQSLVFNDCFFRGEAHRFYSVVNDMAENGAFAGWPDTLQAGANYSALNYMTLGFVNLPLYAADRLFSLNLPLLPYQFVVKALYLILLLAMVRIMQDIARRLGYPEEKAKWIGFLFASSSLFIFLSLIIMHLDIFPLFFALLGIRALLAGNVRRELIYFSVAVLYKPYILLGILPILLLQEKRLLYLLRNGILVMAGTLLQAGIYHFDPGYGEVKAFMEDLYGFVDRFFASGYGYSLNLQEGTAGFFIIGFVVVCVAAYAVRTPEAPAPSGEEENAGYGEKDRRNLYFILPMLVFGLFMLFVSWHPNWLLLAVPFFTMALAGARRFRTACLLDTCISLFVILLAGLGWPRAYDQNMAEGGFLSKVFQMKNQGGSISGILKGIGINPDLYMSLFAGVVTAAMLFVLWEYKNRNRKEAPEEWLGGYIWLRTAPVGIFIVFSLAALFVKA